MSCVWLLVVLAEKLMLQMMYLSRGNFTRKSLVIADLPVPEKDECFGLHAYTKCLIIKALTVQALSGWT